ncbi:hypothetical protein [Photorhabdus viridis]|uniref:hypothetical protein n=1 Tax=Photorhabdus viridis TaxID=3163327 RepID=UPI0033076255
MSYLAVKWAIQPDYYPLSAHEYLYVKVASLAALLHKCPALFYALHITQIRHISDWANFIWQHNGIVLMILGAFDDPGCEIVALGRNENIFSLTKG